MDSDLGEFGEGREGMIEEYHRQLRLKDQQVRLLINEVSHLRREVADARAEAERQFSLNNNDARIANRPDKRSRIEAFAAAPPTVGDAVREAPPA